MKLQLIRDPSGAHATLGKLLVDGVMECWTLEDVVRSGPKVFGETAIPSGTYQVVVTFSQRFQQEMPLLKDVPGFEGIRIHPGNTDKDTHGCVLVGQSRSGELIGHSRTAYAILFPKIQSALKRGESVTIEVG